MTTHYTAVLQITATEDKNEVKDRYDKITAVGGRTVTDAASIVVRAETMERLQDKLIAHVALLKSD